MARKYWRGGFSGDWDQDTYDDFIMSGAAVEDAGNSEVDIPCTGCEASFVAGQTVVITNTTNYNGMHEIIAVTTNQFTIKDPNESFEAETFASPDKAEVFSHWMLEDGTNTVKPVSTDEAVFDDHAWEVPANLATTSPSLNDNKQVIGQKFNCYDGMAQSAITLDALIVTAAFDGCLGGYFDSDNDNAWVNAPLNIKFTATTGQVTNRSNSDVHIELSGGDCAKLIFDSTSGLMEISSNEDGSSWQEIEVISGGTLSLVTEEGDDTQGCDYGLLNCYGADATVQIYEEAGDNGTPGDIILIAGTIYTNSAIDVLTISGGTINHGMDNIEPTEDIDINHIDSYGGSVIWRAAGTLKELIEHGGNITAVGDGNKQLGDSADVIELWSGVLNLSGATGMMTLGATCKILFEGGTLTLPADVDVTWTPQIS